LYILPDFKTHIRNSLEGILEISYTCFPFVWYKLCYCCLNIYCLNVLQHFLTSKLYKIIHWPKRKLDRAISGRHDQTVMTSGKWKAPLKRLRFEFWTYEYGYLLWCVHYNFVCADNLYYSFPIICHEMCKCRFMQVHRSSLIGIKRHI